MSDLSGSALNGGVEGNNSSVSEKRKSSLLHSAHMLWGVCLFMTKCGAEDTNSSRNYHRGSFENFARCLSICDHFWHRDSIATVQDAVKKLVVG